MKKRNSIVVFAAIIGAISGALFLLYLLKGHLKDCPFCSRIFGESAEDDMDFMDDEFPEEAEIPVKEKKEEKPEKPEKTEKPAQTKVRRGYIPIKFHKDTVS